MVAGDATGDAGDFAGNGDNTQNLYSQRHMPTIVHEIGVPNHPVTGRNRARLKRGKIAPRELHTSLTRLYAGLADF